MRRATSARPPKYCRHKATGRAYVTINGKENYLGPYGSQESKDAYARLLARQGVPEPAESDAPLTVDQVVAGFWIHAKKVYPAPPVPEKKRPTGELGNHRALTLDRVIRVAPSKFPSNVSWVSFMPLTCSPATLPPPPPTRASAPA
jgi:hypothetical protein